MKDELITNYSIAMAPTKELLYIPKLNTDLFRDGNGIPLLRRVVHQYTINNKYKEIGCDDTAEHCCPLCDAEASSFWEVMSKVDEKIKDIILSEEADEDTRNSKLIAAKRKEMISSLHSEVQFRKLKRVYLVVANVSDADSEVYGELEFKLQLMSFTLETYINKIKDLLLSSDKGVYLEVTYAEAESMVDKARSRQISLIDSIRTCYTESLEKLVEREVKSLHRLDLEALRKELRFTPYEEATRLALIHK